MGYVDLVGSSVDLRFRICLIWCDLRVLDICVTILDSLQAFSEELDGACVLQMRCGLVDYTILYY